MERGIEFCSMATKPTHLLFNNKTVMQMNSNLTVEESKLILQKIGKLPISFRSEIMNFIDYVCVKYENNTLDEGDELELSEYGKSFLDERMKAMQNDSKANSSWEDVRSRLYKKYKWEE
jgi:hypothetical protein